LRDGVNEVAAGQRLPDQSGLFFGEILQVADDADFDVVAFTGAFQQRDVSIFVFDGEDISGIDSAVGLLALDGDIEGLVDALIDFAQVRREIIRSRSVRQRAALFVQRFLAGGQGDVIRHCGALYVLAFEARASTPGSRDSSV
jgi:hypothetical protein